MILSTLITPLLHATHTTPTDWLEHYAEALVLGVGIVGLLGVVLAAYWLQRTQTAKVEQEP